MLFLAIGNAIFVIFFIVFYSRNSQLKKFADLRISELKQKLSEAENEVRLTEERLREELMSTSKRIESLVLEVSQAKKTSENEINLRLESEKQAALAAQKVVDIQNKMRNWESAQNAAIEDSQNALLKIGEDIYHRLNDAYQDGFEYNQGLFEQILEYLQKNQNAAPALQNQPAQTQTTQQNEVTQQVVAAVNANQKPQETSTSKPSKIQNMVAEFAKFASATKQNYFLPNSFDASISKMFFCETALIKKDLLYIFDFKSCNFLEDFVHSTDETSAMNLLKQRLEKYVSYLGNSKYQASINKIISSKNVKFGHSQIFAVVPSDLEIEALHESGYYDRLEDVSVRIVTLDEIIELTQMN